MRKTKRIIFFWLMLLLLPFLQGCNSFNNNFTNDTYEIYNNHFEYIGFSPSVLTSHNFETGSVKRTPVLNLKAKCSYDLIEVTVDINAFSKTNELLETTSVTKEQKITANKEFTLYIEVDEKTQQYTEKVVATFFGKSKYKPDSATKTYTITFVFNNTVPSITKTVSSGKTVSKPSNPIKENYIFSMWCTDFALQKEYDFSKEVESSFVLYAKYIVDYASITNKITSETIKANVTVSTKSYNTFLGIPTSSETKNGSGIIFYESTSGYYYLITNSHVSIKDKDYDKVSYSVEDYKGNKYTAYLKYEDPAYDLAVLYFQKNITLHVIKRANSDEQIDKDVISLGQPNGQNNAISYGNVLGYHLAPALSTAPTYLTNVRFTVMRHSARTASGSSGGALLNPDLKLVGIHYAGARDSSGQFLYGYAIPISKVNEFLDKYIWDKK